MVICVDEKTAERQTSEQFVRFLEDIVTEHDEDQQIHVICDNVSSHKTALVETWLLLTTNVHIHDTLTCSWCLNQVEIRFAKIHRDMIASTTNTPGPSDGSTPTRSAG